MTIALPQSPAFAAKSTPQHGSMAPALPPMRDELNIFSGSPGRDGAPGWVLQDPVSHRFFQIGWREYEILSRWHLGKAQEIINQVNQHTLLNISMTDIDVMLKFLTTHSLTQSRGHAALNRLKQQSDKLNRRDIGWLIKNYLFIRIPLVRPDRFLTRTLPWVRWFGTRTFLLITLICALSGIYLAQRNWTGFLSQFPHFFTLQGLLLMAVALSVAKVLHELGHAYTCKHFGCRVPSMGVALLVMWPVLYTDASDAWRLRSRRQRFCISAAGMAAELTLAVYATLLWSFLPDGPLRSAIFLLATTTWIVTLFINLNPFMRFDGYYLLSDMLGIPNLQDRAFAIGRWRLREALFGYGDKPPEQFSASTQRLLLVYTYGTWIYRFFLFIGIALLVYFLFFKLLGIFLMVVELVWFIGKPVWTEARVWYERRQDIRWRHQGRRSLIGIAAVSALLVFPWQQDIAAPALWQAQQHSRLYSPMPAQVSQILVQPGQPVNAGDPILQLSSPDLDYEIRQGQISLELLRWQTEFQSINAQLLERAPVVWQELQAETASQQLRNREHERLLIRSPVNGVLRDMPPTLSEGQWLAANELLGIVVTPELASVDGWVHERNLARFSAGSKARFFPDDVTQAAFDVQILSVDTASTRQLPDAWLASTQGGGIAVRQDADGRLIPEQPVYRIRAVPENMTTAPDQIQRGTLHIEGSRESLLLRLWRTVTAVLIRESGF